MDEIIAALREMNTGAETAAERRAQWLSVGPSLKIHLENVASDVNSRVNEGRPPAIRLVVRAGAQPLVISIGFGNNSTGQVVAFGNNGKGVVMERGAHLVFEQEINGKVTVSTLAARIEHPAATTQEREVASFVASYDPEQLNNAELVLQLVKNFVAGALQAHWSLSEAKK